MREIISQNELSGRLERFRRRMEMVHPRWRTAVIISKINQYYFTGTMQDGILFICRDGDAIYWVRRSFERAGEESLFGDIRYMDSYREAAAAMGDLAGDVHLETGTVPLAMYQRLQKSFGFTGAQSLDKVVSELRSVKSPYELSLMVESGRIHRIALEEEVPKLLREGMSEPELASDLFRAMIDLGYQGVSRFKMFEAEFFMGYVSFGENSSYPTYFDGPGGNYGSPAVPMLGNRNRRLKKGDLVFIDIGCGYEGYHTDKTMTYVFGESLPAAAIEAHKKCVEIQNTTASMLKPGAIPSDIFNKVMSGLDEGFIQNFMGGGIRKANFLGHGIGLHIDELPVIAKGFDEPLEEGMAIAIEPKKAIAGVGTVGIENTFLVTAGGGRCITGDNPGLITVQG